MNDTLRRRISDHSLITIFGVLALGVLLAAIVFYRRGEQANLRVIVLFAAFSILMVGILAALVFGYRQRSLRDRTEQRHAEMAEDALRRKAAADAALSELSLFLLEPGTAIESVAPVVLHHARALTGSEHGYVASIDLATGAHVTHTFPETIDTACRVGESEARMVFPRGPDGRYGGLWGHSLNTREAFFTNKSIDHPAATAVPAGHIPLYNLLSVPVIIGDELLGQITLANSPGGYSDENLEIMRRLAQLYGMFLRYGRIVDDLRESETRFRTLYEQSPVAYQSLDADGRIVDVNETWLVETGYTQEEVIGKPFSDLLVDVDPAQFREQFEGFKAAGRVHAVEFEMRRKDGKKIFVTFEGRVGWNAEEAFVRAHCVFVNMTERRMLEDQLRQVQKMESVGRLAGGVAHDFNNMLGVIIGHAEMALREVDESDPLYASLQEILKASQRSVDLTRQMLAFARRQTVNPQVLDLNKAVSGMFKMLRRLIGEDVDLIQKPGPDLWPVKMDPAQFDQIIANLAINARDAISGVGAVTIETGNTSLDGAYCGTHAGAVPGEYVFVTVSDTGAGMDGETLEHIFEPFFTTKEVGKGTGLGLATVYGIVKQNNGFIDVLTAPGRGTSFRIYLPRTWAKIEEAPARSQGTFSGGSETVLLVEDEEAILNLIKTILERSGYTVLSALSPREALTLAGSYAGTIHVLVTDVVMPEMNGRELAERISAIKPGLKTLYMSGYTADVIAHQGVLHEGVQFLQKPMTARELTDKIRDVLDRDVISSKNLPRS